MAPSSQHLIQLTTAPDEQTYMQSSLRVAGHELDLSFITALRDAEAHPLASGPDALKTADRVRKSPGLRDAGGNLQEQIHAKVKEDDAQGGALQKVTHLTPRRTALEMAAGWSGAARQDCSGKPGATVKPRVGGMEIAVCNITRANERFAVRAGHHHTERVRSAGVSGMQPALQRITVAVECAPSVTWRPQIGQLTWR